MAEWQGEFYPAGAKFRELFENTQTSNLTRTGISELVRNRREIQSVDCSLTFAQDHTFDVVNNYQKRLGAKACWTCCTETGEIAAACLVRDTKARQYAHAAEQLVRRNNFNPKIMYADTWPSNERFWKLLFGESCSGRLGLFHFITRTIKTLRESHVDYRKAVYDLLMSIYYYEEEDYARLIAVLKGGLMARDGYKYTDEEIEEMKLSCTFKIRYNKWLRKIIFPPPDWSKTSRHGLLSINSRGRRTNRRGREG
jgi:hypothetical protein